MDDDLLHPAIILIPAMCSYRVIVLIQPADCTSSISSDITISEHTFHLVLPLMPVLICQMVAISNFADVQLFLRSDQVNGSIIKGAKMR